MIFFVYNRYMDDKLIAIRVDEETLEKYQKMSDDLSLTLSSFLKMILKLYSDKVYRSLKDTDMTFDLKN